MVTWSGLVGGQDPKTMSSVQRRSSWREERTPDAVGVQEHAEQELGVVGGMAVPIVTVGLVEGLQVELVDDVQHEPGEVAVRQPVAQVRGQQEGLVAVTAQKVVGHGPFYLIKVFAPNALILYSVLHKRCG